MGWVALGIFVVCGEGLLIVWSSSGRRAFGDLEKEEVFKLRLVFDRRFVGFFLGFGVMLYRCGVVDEFVLVV